MTRLKRFLSSDTRNARRGEQSARQWGGGGNLCKDPRRDFEFSRGWRSEGEWPMGEARGLGFAEEMLSSASSGIVIASAIVASPPSKDIPSDPSYPSPPPAPPRGEETGKRRKRRKGRKRKKEKKHHPAANNSSGIMIRATIHRIVLPTSCHGIVSRVFGCHPSAAKWPDTFSPVPPPCPATWRGDVPVFRVSRLFIIIIAIADLMSNASASAVFFYYRPASLAPCFSMARRGVCVFVGRRVFISPCVARF